MKPKKALKPAFPELPINAREIHIDAPHKVCWMIYRSKFRYGAIRLPYPQDKIDILEAGYTYDRRERSTTVYRKLGRADAVETPKPIFGVRKLVRKDRVRYQARIKVQGKNVNLGMYDDDGEAYAAFLLARKQLREFGELKSA